MTRTRTRRPAHPQPLLFCRGSRGRFNARRGVSLLVAVISHGSMLRFRRVFSSAAREGIPALGAIDTHTHMYLPRYMEMMRNRKEVPVVRKFKGQDRLIILPGEDTEGTTAAGRPIGPEYFDVSKKLAFMNTHNITTSVISLANPWLDFLKPAEARDMATRLNDDMQTLCASPAAEKRLYGFGVLPTLDADGCVAEIRRIASQPHMRGVIMGMRWRSASLPTPTLPALGVMLCYFAIR